MDLIPQMNPDEFLQALFVIQAPAQPVNVVAQEPDIAPAG